jgi:uncharacterized membrane protein YozB (DUF420 family)
VIDLDTRVLPSVNAALNLTSGLLLVCGYAAIRRRHVALHRALMAAAVVTSALFLCSYLVYHFLHGHRTFAGTGWIRPVYSATLVSHTVLAAAVVPMAAVTLLRAWRGDFARHRAIARVLLPVWLYVSVTGVTVYWLLYHVYA